MHIYSTSQWVLLFFIYCFCGWVWESCYVSICKRRWVNRGFLRGPILPIYGFGAILILFVTLPVKNNLALVWLFGMLAATILEYVTGAVMEKIFQVRYWDYSHHMVQLNGYICLSSSIAWGFFSILLIRFIHPPVGRFLNTIPDWVVDPLAFFLVAVFMVDVVRSVQAALDLRDMLKKLTEENEELRRLAKRAEVVAAFAEEDLRKFRERTELEKLWMELYIKEERDLRHQAHAKKKSRRKERLESIMKKGMDMKLHMLEEIAGVFENSIKQHKATDEKKEEINHAIEKVWEYKHKIKEHRVAKYRNALRIIHSNPSALAKDFKEVMDFLRHIDKDNG